MTSRPKLAIFTRLMKMTNSHNMVWLRKITGLSVILAIVLLLSGANSNKNVIKQVNQPVISETVAGQVADITDLRQTAQSSITEPQVEDTQSTIQNLETYYEKRFSSIGVNLLPGTEHREDSSPTPESMRVCNDIIYSAMAALPAEHTEKLRDLTLFYTEDGRRGLGGNGEIIVRCDNVDNYELAAVFVHEMGHITDGSYLKGTKNGEFSGFYDFEVPVTKDDASSLFYKISWKSETEKRSNSKELDFVSQYAATDPFEDFAETYTFYRLHGAEFRKLAKSNYLLDRKYRFMKKYVFANAEFGLTDTAQVSVGQRNYDSTVIPFDLEEFIG